MTQAYKEFVDSAFPFAAKTRSTSDATLIEAMRKEASKGPIIFNQISSPSPLQDAAKRMRLPDDFRKKMMERKKVEPQKARKR